MKTNSLKYSETRTYDRGKLRVTIRLDDECSNGHQDFAITARYVENGKVQACGCMHEDILKAFPEFALFVELHLSDFNGIPMYAVENGFYHLNKMSAEKFCSYYRVTREQWELLRVKASNQNEYALLLADLEILAYWKTQAEKGIKLLEELTGDEFLNDSIKDNISRYYPRKEG